MVAESRLGVPTDSAAAGTELVLQGHSPRNRPCVPRAGEFPVSHRRALSKRGTYSGSPLTASEARAARPAVTVAGQGGGSTDVWWW